MDSLLSSNGSLDVCVQPWKSMPSHLAMMSFEGKFSSIDVSIVIELVPYGTGLIAKMTLGEAGGGGVTYAFL